MKSPSVSNLLDEIVTNARKDRKRLEKVADKMVEVVEDPEGMPELQIGVAENLAKISEALTRSNAQLVILAQMQMKSANEDPKSAVDRERSKLYDELERDRPVQQ